jgi:hypothetical protein
MARLCWYGCAAIYNLRRERCEVVNDGTNTNLASDKLLSMVSRVQGGWRYRGGFFLRKGPRLRRVIA